MNASDRNMDALAHEMMRNFLKIIHLGCDNVTNQKLRKYLDLYK